MPVDDIKVTNTLLISAEVEVQYPPGFEFHHVGSRNFDLFAGPGIKA
jgi:hypothetical protein